MTLIGVDEDVSYSGSIRSGGSYSLFKTLPTTIRADGKMPTWSVRTRYRLWAALWSSTSQYQVSLQVLVSCCMERGEEIREKFANGTASVEWWDHEDGRPMDGL